MHPSPLTRRTTRLLAWSAAAMAVACLGMASTATAVIITDGPEEMIGVGVEEKVGAQIPLDLQFRDRHGLPLTLAKLFDGERPVLLTLNYSNCPMLCGRQLNDLVRVLQEMEWNAGTEFDVVSVSIDPTERPERAKQTHKRYTEEYGRTGTADGWHFLVGDSGNIATLADTVGFRYKYIADTGEYSHAAALMVMTPDGVVSRYLDGLGNDAKTLRMSLVEAGEGKIGTAMDRIWLTCFVYDHTKGKYGPHAFRIMQVGAATTVLAIALGLTPYWLRRRRINNIPSVDSASMKHADAKDTMTP